MTHYLLWYVIGHNKYLYGDRYVFSHISLCDTAQSLVLSNIPVVPIVSVTNKEHILTHYLLWYVFGHNKYLYGDRYAFSHISLCDVYP